jgi:hypothetical protein
VRFLTVLAAGVAAACVAPGAAAASATSQVDFGVGFTHGARLGDPTSVSVDLRLDPTLPPATEFRLLTPAGLTLSDSRLGTATCRSSATEITRVMGPVRQHPCPANSLLGSGKATAGLLLDPGRPLFGAALIELHAGPSVADKPGLLIMANTYNPARMQLTYAGYLYVAPPAFGLGLAILVTPIPHPPFGAPVALSTLQLTVGQSSIKYYRLRHGRRESYHPGGIPLPDSCPTKGFRFRAIIRFTDSSRRAVDAVVPCPPRANGG